MLDQWVQRTGAEYARALFNLLPTGPAWPREPGTVLEDLVNGQTKIWGDQVEALAATLLTRESDPRATVVLLPDWERAFGLPDTCLTVPVSISDRQTALVNKMTLLGAQSRAFFTETALALGYTITILEYSPFMVGYSRCGDTRNLDDGTHYRWQLGPPEMRFFWTVQLQSLRLTWFRVDSGQCGIDPMLRIALATDLQCILTRWKPAHTEIIFDYSPLSGLDYEKTYDLQYLALGMP